MSQPGSHTVGRGAAFEDPPQDSLASRRAIIRWSDGTEGEALRWYHDGSTYLRGNLIGKTREQLRSRHFCRDRDWLQS